MENNQAPHNYHLFFRKIFQEKKNLEKLSFEWIYDNHWWWKMKVKNFFKEKLETTKRKKTTEQNMFCFVFVFFWQKDSNKSPDKITIHYHWKKPHFKNKTKKTEWNESSLKLKKQKKKFHTSHGWIIE